MSSKAALYIRVSTDRQVEEGFSLEAQQDILMKILEKKGIDLYRVYSDPGISGGTFKRPGIQSMLTDMKAGRFDTILIHKLDRLSRNQGDLYGFIDLINKLNVRLIIAAQGDEEIDTRSPMGRAFLSFSGIWAEFYLHNLREETLKGQIKKAQKGGRHMSRPPLGYEYDANRNLVIVEKEAAIVREIFSRYLSGWGVVKIAKHMNEFSSGKEGGKWDSKSVRNIINNPTYAGFNHFKPEDWDEDKRIITVGGHQPIISNEDFERVKGYISRRSKGQMSMRYYNYPYSGIVKCAKCGSNFSGNTTVQSGKEYRTYRCFNNYTKNTCDAPSVSERTLNRLVFENILMMDDSIQPKKEERKKELIDLQKEVEVSNRRRKNWLYLYGDGKMSDDQYSELIQEEDARMKEIYEKLKVEQEEMYEPEIPVDDLRKMMLHIKDNWSYIEPATQKELIQNMFRKIVILKEENGWKIVDLLTV